ADGASRARTAGRRRAAGAGSVAAVVALVGLGTAVLLPDGGPRESLQLAAPDPSAAVPDRVSGRVTDTAGRPLARVAVLPTDLSRVLTRTDETGRYVVRCGTDLVLAPYAPSPDAGPVVERSPGVADVAWRQVRAVGRCGERVDVVLVPGGAVEGAGRPGEQVLLRRAVGATDRVLPRGPVFATRVRADGRWRVEGLDTGRYLLDGRPVDVREGRTTQTG
ncbi:MAG: hypothetical protein JWM64_2535, partial [Frankiales bacterium]|nr:hypothetical protein [Frankiales bacterium]